MIQTIDDAMQMLNIALSARKFYWAEHPAAKKPLVVAAEQLTRLLTSTSSICIIGFPDRVIAEETELPSGPKLCSGLFAALRARGTESLTFVRGISVGELETLVEQLATKESTGPLRPCPCLKLGRIGQGVPHSVSTVDDSNHAAKLKSLWLGLAQNGNIDRGLLDSAASNITANLRGHADSAIQLAAFKSHDDYTFVHTTNVAILAAAMGQTIGLASPLVHELTIAALMHDVGKRRVPREVLNKNTALSAGEFNVVARHPSDGAGMLFGIKDLPPIAAIVAYEHHMHPDGSGYPRVKIGRQMQLASQIVQIADVFDALRSNRPFRAGLSFDEARAVMYKDVQRFYDPALLDTFFATLARRVVLPDIASRLVLPSKPLLSDQPPLRIAA